MEFLIRAKRATYAGKGAETVSSREKSHDLTYRDGDYMYYDTYLGTGKFAGEEALWINNTPFWSMNYIGRVIGHPFSGDFLKEALLHVPEDKPFRGPESYSTGTIPITAKPKEHLNGFTEKRQYAIRVRKSMSVFSMEDLSSKTNRGLYES